MEGIDKQKEALRDDFIKGKLTPTEYWNLRDELDAARQEMVKLEVSERKALQVEEAIKRAGGVVPNRTYGQIPNPWLPEFRSLTNVMALEKHGDFNLIAVLKNEAGVLSGDRRLAMAKAERERLEQQQKYLDEIERMRAVNDVRLNRQQPHSDFADKVAESQRKNRSVIPYFGG